MLNFSEDINGSISLQEMMTGVEGPDRLLMNITQNHEKI